VRVPRNRALLEELDCTPFGRAAGDEISMSRELRVLATPANSCSQIINSRSRPKAMQHPSRFVSLTMPTNHSTPAKGFHVFATSSANWVGSKWAFVSALLVVIIWLLCGPYFHYSDTWQLVINTGTTVVTFLVVFLIQNTQNRDARATPVTVDETIKARSTLNTSRTKSFRSSQTNTKRSERNVKTELSYEGTRKLKKKAGYKVASGRRSTARIPSAVPAAAWEAKRRNDMHD
jgi:low affinity Fe/Cu permease